MEARSVRVQAQVKSHENIIFNLYVFFHISIYLIVYTAQVAAEWW